MIDDELTGDGALYWGNRLLVWGLYALHWRSLPAAGDTETKAGIVISAGDTTSRAGLAGDGVGQSLVGLVLTNQDMITS